MTYNIYQGDIIEWVSKYTGTLFHACLCDPPYHLTSIVKRFANTNESDDTYTSDKVRRGADGYSRLIRGGFMGQTWDGGDVAFRPETWEAIGKCLLPGAYLLAFGGTRTWHRLACAIEDAGFEIRDTIAWIYGQGFPKNHNISKAIDKTAGAERKIIGKNKWSFKGEQNTEGAQVYEAGKNKTFVRVPVTLPATELAKTWEGYGTMLKPAFEPIIVARKPMINTIAENCVEFGSGALNIDGCRIPGEAVPVNKLEKWSGFGEEVRPDYEQEINEKGRWPANVIHDGSEAVLNGFPHTTSGKMGEWNTRHTDGSPNGIYGKFDADYPLHETIGDSGSASRFFYCAKVSKDERDAGLREFEISRTVGGGGMYNIEAGSKYGSIKGPTRNSHPTLKPITLTEYLARLVLPPAEYSPRRILVPFSGSGSEMIGAYHAGWEEIVGIELMEEYCKISEARLKHWTSIPRQIALDI